MPVVLDKTSLLEQGWKIQKGKSLSITSLQTPIYIEEKLAKMWPLMSHGLRWMIIDQLRRYESTFTKDSGWARMRLAMPANLILSNGSGDIFFRPNRRDPGTIKMSFQNDEKDFRSWDPGNEPHADMLKLVSINDLKECPIALSPKAQTMMKSESFPQIDELSKRILKRIPSAHYKDVCKAIVRHRLTFNLTNNTGDAGKIHPVNFGVEERFKVSKYRLVPTGYITDRIYFQSGRLMIKTADMPNIIVNEIDVGYPIQKLIDINVNDGKDGSIKPFEDLVVTHVIRGETWQKQYLSLTIDLPE